MSEMNKKGHAEILSAYIDAMPPIVLKQVLAAVSASWAEMLNGNAASQLQAGKHQREVISAAIDCMLDHDLDKIENLIIEVTTDDQFWTMTIEKGQS